MICGLLVPNQGEVLFEGNHRFETWHTHIGLVPQDLAIYLQKKMCRSLRLSMV